MRVANTRDMMADKTYLPSGRIEKVYVGAVRRTRICTNPDCQTRKITIEK